MNPVSCLLLKFLKIFKQTKIKIDLNLLINKMIIPVRCMSCRKPIGHLWEEFKSRVEKGEDSKKVLEELGLERFCCRAMFLGQVDTLELVNKFKKF